MTGFIEKFRFAHRYDTAALWTSLNPILAPGELGIESDTGKIKWGDGVTAWNSLAYSVNTLLNGASNPAVSDGIDGDFYINTTSSTLFGPKVSGAWPVGVSLIGPQGPQGVVNPVQKNMLTIIQLNSL